MIYSRKCPTFILNCCVWFITCSPPHTWLLSPPLCCLVSGVRWWLSAEGLSLRPSAVKVTTVNLGSCKDHCCCCMPAFPLLQISSIAQKHIFMPVMVLTRMWIHLHECASSPFGNSYRSALSWILHTYYCWCGELKATSGISAVSLHGGILWK